MPKPPASLTAATRRAPAIPAIGAERIGCRLPSRAVNVVLIAMSVSSPTTDHRLPARRRKMNNREQSRLVPETSHRRHREHPGKPGFARPQSRVLCAFSMPAPVLSLIDAATLWPERGALVGLDLGTKTIGVAVSDPDRRLATAVETIQRKAFKLDAARLLAIAAERNAVGFVLGLPINMDGSEGPRAQSTRAFARNLAQLADLAIAFWDERLSTSAVERELIGLDVSRAKRAEVIDQHAAIFILQGALDRLANIKKS